MIYLAFGSNLKSKNGNSTFIINKAYYELEKSGLVIKKKSSFYRSKAYPNPKDPEFINSVALCVGNVSPIKLLNIILKIEKKFGRFRLKKNSPRTLDIDIIDFKLLKLDIQNKFYNLKLPHENLEKRLFVLMPLLEISPLWKSPKTSRSINYLINKLSRLKDNKITKL